MACVGAFAQDKHFRDRNPANEGCMWTYTSPHAFKNTPLGITSTVFVKNLSFEDNLEVYLIWRKFGSWLINGRVIDPATGHYVLRSRQSRAFFPPDEGSWSVTVVTTGRAAVNGIYYNTKAAAITFTEECEGECCGEVTCEVECPECPSLTCPDVVIPPCPDCVLENECCQECEECEECPDPNKLPLCHVATPDGQGAGPHNEIQLLLPLPAFDAHIREHELDYSGLCDGRTLN
jgi:hypothetical protein